MEDKEIANKFILRLYDLETAKSILELMQTGKFASKNELLNRAVQIGVEKIYLEFGKRKALASPIEVEKPDGVKIDEMQKAIKENRVLTEDIFVLMNSIEIITATVLNVLRAEVLGEDINADMIDGGLMARLPPYAQQIKDDLTAKLSERFKKRR